MNDNPYITNAVSKTGLFSKHIRAYKIAILYQQQNGDIAPHKYSTNVILS
jgi:hypothetical protein